MRGEENSWWGCCEPLLSACRYRPASSVWKISYHNVICLAAWLNAHLLMRLRLCMCVSADLFRLQVEWRRLFICCPEITHTHTQKWQIDVYNSEKIFTNLRTIKPSNKHCAFNKKTSWAKRWTSHERMKQITVIRVEEGREAGLSVHWRMNKSFAFANIYWNQ